MNGAFPEAPWRRRGIDLMLKCGDMGWTRPSVTWLKSRWWLAACDRVMSAISTVLSTRVGRHNYMYAENLRRGFLYGLYRPGKWLWIDSNGKMKHYRVSSQSSGHWVKRKCSPFHNRKLSCRRRTAPCAQSVEILSTLAQLYWRKIAFEKDRDSWTTYKFTLGHRKMRDSISLSISSLR